MPVAALFIDWALTASWPLIGQSALAYFDAATFGFLGAAAGLLTLAPFLLRGGRLARLFEPSLRLRLFWLGALGTGLPGFFQVTAMRFTTPGDAAIVAQVEVLYSLVLSVLLLGERVTSRQIAGTVLVLAGTALILARDLGTPHWKGDLILIAIPWMFQLSHVLSKKLPADVDHLTIAGARLFYGGVVLGLISLLSAFLGLARFVSGSASWGLIAYQAVLLGSLNMWFWYFAIRSVDLAKATAVLLSYPAMTLLYSWLLGAERVSAVQIGGLILSMTGAIWIALQMREGLPIGEVAGGAEADVSAA